jgi:RHS repeat-associated protein
MVVNGGGQLGVHIEHADFLPVDRQLDVPWQGYAFIEDRVLVHRDPNVTAIDTSAPLPAMVAHRSSVEQDAVGKRQATLLFPRGLEASMEMPDGSTRPLPEMHVRATEYTVGQTGPAAMPAPLPATSAYTYAADFGVDEARAAGAAHVRFTKPVVGYLENFRNAPVGGRVPNGYYERSTQQWVPDTDGRVVKVLSESAGLAALDVTGGGQPASAATLATIGIDEDELRKVAELYEPGQELWRVPTTHFSDWNYGPRVLGAAQPAPAASFQGVVPDPCTDSGSVIECENQTLGEDVPVNGSAVALHYRSDRVPGRTADRNAIEIPLTGATLPAGLVGVELRIDVAGRRFEWRDGRAFAAQPNLSHRFAWDGKDEFGRTLQGAQQARVSVGYVYGISYRTDPLSPEDARRGFGVPPDGSPYEFAGLGGAGAGGAAVASLDWWQRPHIVVWRPNDTTLGGWDARAAGLGGWTLTPHHQYDPVSKTMYRGDGSKRSVTTVDRVINRFAGTGSSDPSSTTGTQATKTSLFGPEGMDVGPDGSVYIADFYNDVVRRVAPDGTIAIVAGRQRPSFYSPRGFSGDGGPATQADIYIPTDVDVAADGSLFITDYGNHRIRKVDPRGIITTVAGGADPYASDIGDGKPATQASLRYPNATEVAPDGTLFILDRDHYRIRRVGPDGIITTYAGGGDQGADDIPATKYYFHWYYEPLRAMALAPDGSLYVATSAYLRRIGPDGFIKRVAGDGRYSYEYNVNEKRTVAPALDATITTRAVTVSSDGTVYFTDPGNKRIWRLDNDGKVRVVAGDGNGSNPGGNADGGPALEGHLDIPQGLAVGPDGAMYVSDWSQNNVRRISDPLPGFDGRDIAIPSEDGRELYRFDATGRHLETRDTSNGTVIARFGYDDRGRLASIEDAHANVIRVQRDAAGQPLAIVAPFGQRTTLGVGSDGFLASIADPAGRSWALGYERAGLLTSFARPGGATSRMQYAADGRLIRDENADGGVKTLARTDTPGTYEVTLSTSLGRTRTAGVVRTEAGATLRTATAADGVSTQTRTNGDGSQTTTRTDGSKVSTHGVRDPRFGLQAPYLDSVATTRPSGATSTVTSSRAVDLADENDVLSVRSIVSSSKAGSRTTTTRWDRAAGTTTTTLPSGLAAVLTADASGQVLRSHTPGIADVTYDYDAYGRRTATHQGERTSTVTYDAAGRVASSTDPLGRTTRYERDALGRVTTATLPDGREVRMTYDAAGDLRSVTPPSRPAHGFLYTLTGLRSSWQAAGDASAVTRYGYDADQQLTSIERADGTTTALDRDSAGRLSAMRRGGWLVDYDYDAASGLLASVTGDDGTKTSWTYDGTLPRSETTTGAVAGQAQIDYDADGRVVSSAVNGTPAVTFAYDADGAPTRIGDLAFTRSATTGQLTGTALGDSTTAFGYDGYGGLAALQASQAGAALFAESYERDRAGRVTKRTETVGGETHEHEYGYDAAGRLASVKRDGTTVATYAFDQNGNRVTVDAAGSAPVSADFDDQDRLLRQGTTTYRYTAAGELRERTTGDGAATRYSYDAAGSLTGVELPDGRVLSYLTDGVGRRIGTKVDGVLERGFVYGETGLPSAELDGDGAVRSRFVYGTRTAVPEYMQRGGRTYRIVSDQLGSVRLVVDVQSGEVAQRIDYDPFGRVVADSSPGFQPFGYAGGLYDPRTGLVRFGQRDYDAQTGRWTAKDPVDFAGSDTNLYGYVLGDPINRIDPTGLFPSFEDFANSTVGTFDALSFGYTKWVRDRTYEPLGLHDGTGYCSQQYRWGHIGGEIDRDLAVATFTGNGITGLAMYLGRGPVAAGMIGGAGGSAISTSLGTGGDPVKTLASAALGGFGGGLTAAVFPSAPTTRLIEVYTDEMWGPAVGGASSSMAYGAGTTAGGQSGSGCSCP